MALVTIRLNGGPCDGREVQISTPFPAILGYTAPDIDGVHQYSRSTTFAGIGDASATEFHFAWNGRMDAAEGQTQPVEPASNPSMAPMPEMMEKTLHGPYGVRQGDVIEIKLDGETRHCEVLGIKGRGSPDEGMFVSGLNLRTTPADGDG